MKLLSIIFLLQVFLYSNTLSQSEIDLADYQQCLETNEIITISEIDDNLSGVTYNYNDSKLYAVTNRPTELFKLNLQGEIEVKYILNNFEDTEGVVYLGNNTLAILEERPPNRVVFIEIPEDDSNLITIEYPGDERTIFLNIDYREFNKGLEGIAYDNKTDIMYLCQEKNPKAIFQIVNPSEKLGTTIVPIDFGFNIPSDLKDLAGLHAEDGSLFILSEETDTIIEVDVNTKQVISLLNIEDFGFNQQEGLTMDEYNQLIVVSETNEFSVIGNNELFIADVDNDGLVDVVDALLISRYEVGLVDGVNNCCGFDSNTQTPPLCIQYADLNGDGLVDIEDALLIAQCDAQVPNVACPDLNQWPIKP